MKFIFLVVVFVFNIYASIEIPCRQENQGKNVQEIHIKGLKNTNTRLVWNVLENKKGQKFSCENWNEEKQSLQNLGIFSKVDLVVIEESSKGLILRYNFVPMLSFLPFLSISVSDEKGWLIGPGAMHRNLFGEALFFQGFYQTQLAKPFLLSQFFISFYSYWFQNFPLEYTIQITRRDGFNELYQAKENSLLLKTHFRHRIFDDFHLIYKGTFLILGIDPSDRSRILLNPNKSYELLPKINIGARIDSRDVIENTKKGFYLEGLYGLGGFVFESPNRYQEFLLDLRGYYTLGKRNIFVLSALVTKRLGKVGIYDYFYIGGVNSLRGYSLKDSLSGKNQMLTTLEYRFEFLRRTSFSLSFVKFHLGLQWIIGTDYNSVWTKTEDFADHFHRSYYTGLNILLPFIHRLRLELGTRSTSFELQFQIGLFEKFIRQRSFYR